jgi:hypothetical protein
LRAAVLAAVSLAAAACSREPAPAAETPATSASDGIAALAWVAEGRDAVAFLTTRPAECRKPSTGEAFAREELGRIAFESPALLGGLAARKSLSCSACHMNGRGNPDFFMEGVSGEPGTADVTLSLFSKVRGDDTPNPVPIPDLAARDGKQIRDRTGEAFRAKVHGLIVEEFDGVEPPAEVFAAMLAYLDALDIAACTDPAAREAHTAMTDFSAARLAATAGVLGWREPTAVRGFYLRAARNRLERLHERYAAAELAPVRERLVAISRRLGEEAVAVRANNSPSSAVTDADWAALEALVREGESRSLYDVGQLQAALAWR